MHPKLWNFDLVFVTCRVASLSKFGAKRQWNQRNQRNLWGQCVTALDALSYWDVETWKFKRRNCAELCSRSHRSRPLRPHNLDAISGRHSACCECTVHFQRSQSQRNRRHHPVSFEIQTVQTESSWNEWSAWIWYCSCRHNYVENVCAIFGMCWTAEK